MSKDYTFYSEQGLVKLSVDDRDDVLKFSSRNEVNAFINEITQFRDALFPKLLVLPLTWDWDEGKQGTRFNVEISGNRRFLIVHHEPKEAGGDFSYSLMQRNRSYNPYHGERVEEWLKIGDDSTKVLNLKAIAELMNQESQADGTNT